MPLLPTRLTPHHCRHDPGGGDHTHPASSEACVHPTSYRACPFSPRNVRLGRLSPRRHAWSRRRRACNGGVARERATPLGVCNPLGNLPPEPFPRPSPQGTPEALPSPLLRCLSRPRGAALCLAPGRFGGVAILPWARHRHWRGVDAGVGRWGECCRGGDTKGRLYFLSVLRLACLKVAVGA